MLRIRCLGNWSKSVPHSDTGLLPDFIWAEKSGARLVDANTIESQYDGAYSYNAFAVCLITCHRARMKEAKNSFKRWWIFFMKEQRIYAGYDLNGTALNQYQAGSFLAPITYASDKGEGYLKLLQQNKYIFTQDLPSDNYYDANDDYHDCSRDVLGWKERASFSGSLLIGFSSFS